MADKFQLKAIISAVDKITPTLKGVRRAAKMTNKSLRDIGGAGSKLMGSLGIPAGLAFGSVFYGATRAANAALQYAGAIQDAADRTGASTTEYQTLAAMLEQAGGTAEDAEMAFTQFNKGVSNAAAGADKNFAGLLHKLKIPMRDAQGNVRSLTDMMPELADAFAKNTDPALRTRMAMELFGKSGTKLIPILAGGRAAYAAWAAEQERLGIIIGKDSIGALDDMGDSLGVVNKQIKSQLVQAIASLAPVIQPILKSMQEWIANNKELIQTTITKTLTEIVNALKDVDWAAFIGGIRDTIKAIGSFVEMMGGMKNVLIALGVLWLAGPLSAIFSMIGAFSRLAMVASPVMLVVAAVAAAGYLVYSNWDKLSGMFSGVMASVSGLGDALMGLWNVLSPVLLPVLKFVGKVIGGILLIGIQAVTDAISAMVGVLTIGVDMLAALASFVIPDWLRNMLGGGETSVSVKPAVPASVAKSVAQVPVPEVGGQGAVPSRPSLSASGALRAVQLNGEMTVRFENAPAGMRVAPGRTNQPGVSMNPDVGYRGLGLGL